MNKTTFVHQLPEAIHQSILSDLKSIKLSNEDLADAMNSRLCDLEDTININKYL